MSDASLASLTVATAGLSAVNSILGAMHAADAYIAAQNASRTPAIPQSVSSTNCAPITNSCRDSVCFNHVTVGRLVAANFPSYQPCQSLNGKVPTFKPRLALEAVEASPGIDAAAPHIAKSPIQAPWSLLPWQNTPKQIVKVKIVQHVTDIVTKGSLIDTFI